MAEVEIYSTQICPYCKRAKQLLTNKKVAYKEIMIDSDPALRDAMIKRAGGRQSVPQIFIGGKHVGGCDDLYALDRKGGLDPLLTAP